MIGADLQVDDEGRYTGFMSSPPLVGEARAAWLRRYASSEGRRPEELLRVRGLLLRPAAAPRGGEPRGGVARLAPVPVRAPAPLADRGVGDVEGHAARPIPEAGEEVGTMALALEFYRSAPKYLGARTLGSKAPGLLTGGLAPLRLVTQKDPEPTREGWARVKPRLCRDLRERPLHDRRAVLVLLLAARVAAVRARPRGRRRAPGRRAATSWPGSASCSRASSDAPHGERTRPASIARQGRSGRCDRVTVGHLKPGLQTGYCTETGGGWSRLMLAHRSQLWPVPDGMGDETAVLIEPLACAIHAAFRAKIPAGGTVHVVGAGTVGILTLIAIKALTKADHVIVAAKHQRQRAAASMAGADDVVRPEHAVKAVRRTDHAVKLTPGARDGVPPRWRRRGDRVHGVEQRARPRAPDDEGGWARRRLRHPRRRRRSHPAVVPRARARRCLHVGRRGPRRRASRARRSRWRSSSPRTCPMLEQLVGATYPLDRWRDALDHAMAAGTLGTFKVAFAPQA